MIKTYAIKWEEKILVTSQNKDTFVWYQFIQEEFLSEEHFEKLNSWYSYNIETGLFEETEESKQYEAKILQDKKTSLLKEIWELKQIKDWMELVWDDITEITAKINDLISEYKSL